MNLCFPFIYLIKYYTLFDYSTLILYKWKVEHPIAELISTAFLLFFVCVCVWQSIIVCIQADLILVITPLSFPPKYWNYTDEHYMPNIF